MTIADVSQFEAQAKRLAQHCSAYKGANAKQAWTQVITTGLLFAALSAAVFAALSYSFYWLDALLVLPAAGLLVRLFIIQHDCGHGSFFSSRKANDRLGRLISILTLTPYGLWRRAHNAHHATSGNLDHRGTGDIDTLTVSEYLLLSRLRRIGYRLYRNPLVLLIVGGPYQFIIRQRFPMGWSLPLSEIWGSVLLSNIAIALAYGAAVVLFGPMPLLLGYLPVVVVASWIGGWLFYVQHQFENTRWDRNGNWDFHTSAIYGSSYYVMPRILQWFTGNIGLHHIHHLCGKIPNYRLQKCLEDSPELQGLSRLTLAQSLQSLRLALWDEESRRMVGFRDLKTD